MLAAGHTGSCRDLIALLGQNLLKGREEEQQVCAGAGLSHQSDAPDLTGELSQPTGNFDEIIVN